MLWSGPGSSSFHFHPQALAGRQDLPFKVIHIYVLFFEKIRVENQFFVSLIHILWKNTLYLIPFFSYLRFDFTPCVRLTAMVG